MRKYTARVVLAFCGVNTQEKPVVEVEKDRFDILFTMGRNVIEKLISSYNSPTVDNFVFRLCYRWTVCILIAFAVIITCKLTWGSSFSCTTAYDSIPQPFLDGKCYSEPLFSTPDTRIREELAFSNQRGAPMDDFRIYHSYYPWVNLFLLCQAFLFYLPHLLWKTYESGFVCRLTSGLQVSLGKEQKRSLEIHSLAKYILNTQGKHKLYTCAYILFEIGNFAMALGQTLWLVDFFNVSGIPDYLNVDTSMWSEYRDMYFPSMARCRISRFSASGDRMTADALCTLPLNRLYMKMYLFLRAWYIFLAFCTAVVLVYRMALLTTCLKVAVVRCLAPFVHKSNVTALCHQMTYGDWFFLTAIRKHIPELEFSRVLDRMLAISQNKVKEPNVMSDDDERSSVYEDSRKDIVTSTASTPC